MKRLPQFLLFILLNTTFNCCGMEWFWKKMGYTAEPNVEKEFKPGVFSGKKSVSLAEIEDAASKSLNTTAQLLASDVRNKVLRQLDSRLETIYEMTDELSKAHPELADEYRDFRTILTTWLNRQAEEIQLHAYQKLLEQLIANRIPVSALTEQTLRKNIDHMNQELALAPASDAKAHVISALDNVQREEKRIGVKNGFSDRFAKELVTTILENAPALSGSDQIIKEKTNTFKIKLHRLGGKKHEAA